MESIRAHGGGDMLSHILLLFGHESVVFKRVRYRFKSNLLDSGVGHPIYNVLSQKTSTHHLLVLYGGPKNEIS